MISNNHCVIRAPRRGVTIIEMIVSAIVVAATGVLILSAFDQSRRHESAMNHRVVALAQVENLMQRIITSADTSDAALADLVAYAKRSEQLSGFSEVDLAADVSTTEEDGKRVAIRMTWSDSHGEPVRPIRLVAYMHEEVNP